MSSWYKYVWVFVAVMAVSFLRYETKVEEARERMLQMQEEASQAENQARPEYVKDFQNAKRPEVWRVALKDERVNADLGNASLKDLYEVDVMSSGVVGLVGIPVRVSYDVSAKPRLTFYYNAEELRGIPERNLIILHEGEDGFYVQVGEERLDQSTRCISVTIPEPGIYLLADRYQWYSAWGVDVSEYAYEVDPLAQVSDWERENEVGSIMEIADREWAYANAPVFHVSTPEQLAGVVYYNNALADYGTERVQIELYLEEDIDLAGLAWVPMGWGGSSRNQFNGLIDGQGHSILNMTIDQPSGDRVAFIGYSTGVTVKNVTFVNASVCGGRYTGIVGGEIYSSPEWENVKVSGVISGAKGEVGSIIGREASLHFKDCSADVICQEADGTERRLQYFSHRQELLATTPVEEIYQLKLEENGSITRTALDEDSKMLCWVLDVEGVMILRRNADKETNYDPGRMFSKHLAEGKTCRIWLEAHNGETYVRVSNVIEYK